MVDWTRLGDLLGTALAILYKERGHGQIGARGSVMYIFGGMIEVLDGKKSAFIFLYVL